MEQFLQHLHSYQDTALKVISYLAGAGILDLIMRKIPTQKPLTILALVRKVLGFIAEVCLTIDRVLDAIPGLSQNIKDVEKK